MSEKFFALKKPCIDCPFLVERAFVLRRGSRERIIKDLLHKDRSFPCHKTVNYERRNRKKEMQCAGALILLINTKRHLDNLLFKIATKAGWLKVEEMDLEAGVYASVDDFLNGPS